MCESGAGPPGTGATRPLTLPRKPATRAFMPSGATRRQELHLSFVLARAQQGARYFPVFFVRLQLRDVQGRTSVAGGRKPGATPRVV